MKQTTQTRTLGKNTFQFLISILQNNDTRFQCKVILLVVFSKSHVGVRTLPCCFWFLQWKRRN